MHPPLLRRALAVAALAVLAVLGWTAVALVQARGELLHARSLLTSLRDAPDPAQELPRLEQAQQLLRRADGRLSGPAPAVTARVPLLGRSVRLVAVTTRAARAVVDGTVGVVGATQGGTPLLADGRVDVDRLRRVAAVLDDAARRSRGPVAALDAQPTGLVPGALTRSAVAAQDELTGVPSSFARASAALSGVTGVLGARTPQHLLVCVQNNAELRGAGGVVTVFAEATAQDGRLQLGRFRDVEEVADGPQQAHRVPAPADYHALWGPFLADTTLWVNTNQSPDVATDSQVLAGVAQATLGRRPDAVLWLDVPAIAAVLSATGPARLPDGSELTGDTAVKSLLSDAYAGAVDDRAGQARRRARLRSVADSVLARLTGGDVPSPTRLARGLGVAADGRHLVLWSGDPALERDLQAGGVGGQVLAGDGDVSSVAVQNLGGGSGAGNKLDYYARRQVSVTARLTRTSAVVEQRVQLRNTAPRSGLPVYVAGVDRPGTTSSHVTLALPRTATGVSLTRGGTLVAAPLRPEGDHAVVVDVAVLPPGTTAEWVLRYRLPLRDGRYTLSAVPQPLAVPAGLAVDVRATDDSALTAPAGSPLSGAGDDSRALSERFERVRRLAVRLEPQPWYARAASRVRRFWVEPVRL